MSPDRYKYAVLLIACIGSMMGPLDSTIIGVSLPEIANDLQVDYATVIWIPTAYLVTIAALLLTVGRLSDLIGRKKLYQTGFALFVLGSACCSLSQNGDQIIASRVLQGVGASFLMATATAIITDVFPPKERGKALGINVMFVYIGLSIGPPLGGMLTEWYGWPSIFWVNIPIGIGVMLAVGAVYRETVVPRAIKFDLGGAVCFATTLVSFLLLLTFGGKIGWNSPFILGLSLLTLLSAVWFVRTELRKKEQAMLNLSLFTHNRLFAAANLSALLNYTAYYGVSFIISFYLQRVLELSLVDTGLILLSMPIMMALASPICGWASDRVGSRLLSTAGMVLMAGGLIVLSTLTEDGTAQDVLLGLVPMGIGMGLFSSPNTSACMGAVRKDQLGVASGTISTMRTIGQSLSLTIMGAIISAVAGATIANNIFGGGDGADIEPMLESFIDGMRTAFLTGAGIALLGAVTSSVRGGGQGCVPEGNGR